MLHSNRGGVRHAFIAGAFERKVTQTASLMSVLLAALTIASCSTLPTQPGDELFAEDLTIEPSVVAVGVGQRLELHAVPRDGNGEEVPGYQITWSSSALDIATVSDAGVLTAVSAGKATVTAKAEKPLKGDNGNGRENAPGILKKNIEITVAPTPVASVEVQPAEATVEIGGSVDLDAVAMDDNGSVLTDRYIEWSLSNSSIASIDAEGRVSGLAAGSVTVTATSEGQVGSATVTVEDSPPPPPPPPSSGGAFYVDINNPNASDSNPGTEESPWRTLRKAVETLTAGQTAYVKNGNYVESAGCAWYKPALNPANSGTAGNPIAFRAYPGHRPIVTNSVEEGGCPTIGAYERSYIIWDGFESAGRKAIVHNSDHITLENLVIYGIRSAASNNVEAMRVNDSSDITLRNLLLYDIYNENHSDNASGVKIYNGVRVVVENSEIFDTVTGIFDKSGGLNNEHRYNWIHNTEGNGILLSTLTGHTARGLTAHHNVVAAAKTGIRCRGSSSSHNQDCQIYSNTVAGDRIVVEEDAQGPCDVWNNIIVGGTSNIDSSNPSIGECDHNLFHNTDIGCGISGNPLFVGGSGPEAYKLQSGSPAIGGGRNGGNIGAYETGNEVIGRG